MGALYISLRLGKRRLTLFRRASIGRKVLGRELATVFDYRQRLGQYRTDESLIFAHQNHPWITVW